MEIKRIEEEIKAEELNLIELQGGKTIWKQS